MEPVVSRPTNRRMIEAGVRIAPAELCLPAKVFLGHVLELASLVDVLIIPRIVCRRFGRDLYFGCPKAMALPDMTRALVPDLPPVVEFVLDERQCSEENSYRRLARQLGIGRLQASTSKPQARASEPAPLTQDDKRLLLGLVGHCYLLDDAALSLGLLDKLRSLGAEPGRAEHWAQLSNGHMKPPFLPNWMFEKELIDGALNLAGDGRVRGMVLATSFACGTSAVTNELIRRTLTGARPKLPVMTLMFDEHTSEAGLWTRLESFLDLIRIQERQ